MFAKANIKGSRYNMYKKSKALSNLTPLKNPDKSKLDIKKSPKNNFRETDKIFAQTRKHAYLLHVKIIADA